ncbi:MAG: glutaredoxin family protein [Peptococcaceae bacterium]|jgi:glutaredoxin|nr:glutaredoxin family protein [Peptococcaceae bacterium]
MAFPPVTIYFLPTCPSCKAAKDFLAGHQVPFTAIDVSAPEAMAEMTAKTGTIATPVIVIGGEQVIGWDRNGVKTLLGL